MNKMSALALALGILSGAAARAATPPSIEDFASRPKIEDVSISPDGRYLALIRTLNGRGVAVVMDRQASPGSAMLPVLAEPEHFKFSWCRWATNTRLLCGLHAMVRERFVYSVSRLVAVDADGKNTHVLMQNNGESQGQFQDEIVNWNPGPPNTVLIEADEGLSDSEIASGAQIYRRCGYSWPAGGVRIECRDRTIVHAPTCAGPHPSLDYGQARRRAHRLGSIRNHQILLGAPRRRPELAAADEVRDIQPRESFRTYCHQCRRSEYGLRDRPFRGPGRHLAH